MKQYLLTEDQIERMIACAIELTAEPDLKGMERRNLENRFKHPEKEAHRNAIIMFKFFKQFEIIQPISQN